MAANESESKQKAKVNLWDVAADKAKEKEGKRGEITLYLLGHKQAASQLYAICCSRGIASLQRSVQALVRNQ
jgi:hypothetical protein